MKIPPWATTLLGALVVIALPVFLVLSNVNLIMTPWFVRFQYAKPDFPPSERFDTASRTKFAIETVRYTRGELTHADLQNLNVYNERELSHMRDVQDVATRALALDYALGIFIVVGLLVLWRAASALAAWSALFIGAGLTLAIFGAIGLFALVAFDAFFVLFHRLFFVGDSWLFLTTDSLIQFYPEPFWVDASLGIAVLTLLEALVLLAIGWWGRRVSSKRA
ncbi:MAG: TIGR01906 family membrane protein [Anaerolineae bacterium]|nr:TIGR01906 family membrane protein [Anaerolineae bacterium]